jgi:toxin ParE1/3/4
MPSYQLSPEAIENLIEIRDYMATQNPATAVEIIDGIFSAFAHLEKWPNSGHKRPDLTNKEVLFWPHGHYLVVYSVPNTSIPLQIVAVIHGARNVAELLEEL